MTRRASEYETPTTCMLTKRSVQPGHVRLTALPPNFWETVERGKCAMIWSATITEIPIVISA